MFNINYRNWFVSSALVAGLIAMNSAIAAPQNISEGIYGGEKGFQISRKGETSRLYKAFVVDLDASETETKWYVNISPEELLQLTADPNVRNVDGGTVEESFYLVSDRPDVVAVVNDRYVLATGKRGDANITLMRRTRTRYDAQSAKKGSLEWSAGNSAVFSLGEGLMAQPKIRFRIESNTDRRIIAVPRLKTYKAVRDLYGKGIARNFVVVAVDINNSNPSKQFLVQNVYVSFDPAQCENLADVLAPTIGRTSLRDTISSPKTAADNELTNCLQIYKEYFGFPTTVLPTDSGTMLAIAEVEKYRSPRYMLFKGIKFAADIGSALGPAFNIIGPDGRTGFNFLGGTLTSALDSALPKLSEQKLDNLRADIPKANVIVKGNSLETVNIFIPAEHIFSKEAWYKYRAGYKDAKYDEKFVRHMLMFLVAKSDGILIDENSKQVETKQGGGVPFRNL